MSKTLRKRRLSISWLGRRLGPTGLLPRTWCARFDFLGSTMTRCLSMVRVGDIHSTNRRRWHCSTYLLPLMTAGRLSSITLTCGSTSLLSRQTEFEPLIVKWSRGGWQSVPNVEML